MTQLRSASTVTVLRAEVAAIAIDAARRRNRHGQRTSALEADEINKNRHNSGEAPRKGISDRQRGLRVVPFARMEHRQAGFSPARLCLGEHQDSAGFKTPAIEMGSVYRDHSPFGQGRLRYQRGLRRDRLQAGDGSDAQQRSRYLFNPMGCFFSVAHDQLAVIDRNLASCAQPLRPL